MAAVVVVESPYSGDIEKNTQYALLCMRDSYINHGEAPVLAHLLWTRIDTRPTPTGEFIPDDEEGRKRGLERCRLLRKTIGRVVFYTDRGWSNGMNRALEEAKADGVQVEERSIASQLVEQRAKEEANLRANRLLFALTHVYPLRKKNGEFQTKEEFQTYVTGLPLVLPPAEIMWWKAAANQLGETMAHTITNHLMALWGKELAEAKELPSIRMIEMVWEKKVPKLIKRFISSELFAGLEGEMENEHTGENIREMFELAVDVYLRGWKTFAISTQKNQMIYFNHLLAMDDERKKETTI